MVLHQNLAYHKWDGEMKSDIKPIVLHDDVVCIADSHWKNSDTELLESLNALQNSQVLLMGDIAQMLVGNLATSIESNKALLECIQRLSERSCVYWLEGNHDFGLQALAQILPKVIFVPRKHQPLMATYKGMIVSLAHGDLFLNIRYKLYINVLNSCFGLWALRCVDWLSHGYVYRTLQKSIDSKRIRGFYGEHEAFCVRRVEAYKKYFCKHDVMPQVIIEGHFHLGHNMRIGMEGECILYVCLPSFYIDRRIFELESSAIDH